MMDKRKVQEAGGKRLFSTHVTTAFHPPVSIPVVVVSLGYPGKLGQFGRIIFTHAREETRYL